MSTYIIDLISHLTLRKIGLSRIKVLSPPMPSGPLRCTPRSPAAPPPPEPSEQPRAPGSPERASMQRAMVSNSYDAERPKESCL